MIMGLRLNLLSGLSSKWGDLGVDDFCIDEYENGEEDEGTPERLSEFKHLSKFI